MSYTMAIGMEVYNTAVTAGLRAPGGFTNLTPEIFVSAFQESLLISSLSFCIQSGSETVWARLLWNVTAHLTTTCIFGSFSGSLRNRRGNVPPVMRLTASVPPVILCRYPGRCFRIVWFGTLMKNLPMAFFWNMSAAAPFTHWVFGLIFERGENKAAVNIHSKKAETDSAE